MGSVLYDYLAGSPMLNEHARRTRFRDLSPNELWPISTDLLGVCHSDEFMQESASVLRSRPKIRVLCNRGRPSLEYLAQLALYADDVVILDPLDDVPHAAHLDQRDPAALAHLKGIGDYFAAIQPFVASRFVKFASSRDLASVEADDQRLPHPRDDQFMAGVRADGTVQERAAILLGRTPRARWPLGLKAWAIRAWVDPDPYGEVPRGCRSVKICVAFGDDPDAPPVEFCADAVVAKRTADRITRSRRVSAETIPMMWPRSMRVALYEIAAAWRNNMAAEIIGANQVGAYRVSRSPYLAEVSGLWRRSDASSATLDGLMCLQVPFLRGATPRLLMDARENCWRSLEALRDHLDRAVGELRAEPNEGRMAARAKAITREIQHRQVRELDRAVASLRPVILAKVATGVATLAAAIVGNRNPIVATAIAALVGAQTFLEYRAHVSRSPAFFLLRASGGRRLDPESG